MAFQERFKELLDEKLISYSSVAKKTGIPVTTLSNYINRGSIPSMIQLTLLADFFGCSVDYLIGREDDFGNVSVSSSPSDLSKDEKTLLERFRKLGPFERESILVQIDALSSEEYNARVYGDKPLIKK